MDFEKKIQNLVSENEFLQLQLEDLNDIVRAKDEEILILGDNMDSAAALQSRIDNNLAEIAQLRYNVSVTEEKATGIESMNEALEIELLGEIKARQKDEKLLTEMASVKANLDVANTELEEAAVLYKRIVELKRELAEAKSNLEIMRLENNDLNIANAELKELYEMIRKKKMAE